LDEVQQRELDPLTAVQEIMDKVFHLPSAARLQPGSSGEPDGDGNSTHTR
jgi:hypothetical protein